MLRPVSTSKGAKTLSTQGLRTPKLNTVDPHRAFLCSSSPFLLERRTCCHIIRRPPTPRHMLLYRLSKNLKALRDEGQLFPGGAVVVRGACLNNLQHQEESLLLTLPAFSQYSRARARVCSRVPKPVASGSLRSTAEAFYCSADALVDHATGVGSRRFFRLA